jgi:choline-phosphate cytidylyltransferase
VRVYADGVFDMFHIGHAKVLEQAKKLFPHVHLVVGVSGDKETIEKKGKIVMNQDERVEIIKHCKWVDEVICPCPWVLDVSFLKKNNIDYVAHDDLPYGSVGQKDIYAEIKAAGMFKATQRTEGISTSDIILRIIRDYDLYVQRSLERGATRREIGVSQSKLLRIKMKKAFKGFVSGFDKKGELNLTSSTVREQMNHFVSRVFPVPCVRMANNLLSYEYSSSSRWTCRRSSLTSSRTLAP